MYLLACGKERIREPEVAVFADTGVEPQYVYDHLDRLEQYGREHGGPPIVRVSAGNLMDDTFTKRSVSPPLWVRKPDGTIRPGGRWCTDKYKTRPINKFLREFAEVPRGAQRVCVEVSLGISTDEALRQKDAREPWLAYRHPLLDLGMSRRDCIEYLESVGWGTTPKSACHFCPYHNDSLWAEIKELDPAGWQTAVEFDERARHGTRGVDEKGATFFVHRSGLPLSDVTLPAYVPGAGHGGVGCSPYACIGDDIAAVDAP